MEQLIQNFHVDIFLPIQHNQKCAVTFIFKEILMPQVNKNLYTEENILVSNSFSCCSVSIS